MRLNDTIIQKQHTKLPIFSRRSAAREYVLLKQLRDDEFLCYFGFPKNNFFVHYSKMNFPPEMSDNSSIRRNLKAYFSAAELRQHSAARILYYSVQKL